MKPGWYGPTVMTIGPKFSSDGALLADGERTPPFVGPPLRAISWPMLSVATRHRWIMPMATGVPSIRNAVLFADLSEPRLLAICFEMSLLMAVNVLAFAVRDIGKSTESDTGRGPRPSRGAAPIAG
jgi:hypothetical protein